MSNELTQMNMFEVMEKALKFSEIIAKSDIIPTHYRSKPANVFIAVQTAYRMNMDPMLIMQNTFVVSGKLGMSASFSIALANQSGLFTGGIRYKVMGSGADLSVTAYTNIKSTGEEISYTVSMKMAQSEGWTKNSKYQTMPELMLRYRSAAFLIRTHAPEVLNGMHMVEELDDVNAANSVNQNPIVQTVSQSATERLLSKISSKQEAVVETVMEPVLAIEKELNLAYELSVMILDKQLPDSITAKWLEKAQVGSFAEMNDEELQKCITYINEKY